MLKKTLVVGASENPERYAYKAIVMLREYGHEVEALAKREGNVSGIRFSTTPEPKNGIDTVTLYLGPKNQPEYYDYIINLSPKRVIFNPGTENSEFVRILKQNQIEAVEACTLVMLRTGQY